MIVGKCREISFFSAVAVLCRTVSTVVVQQSHFHWHSSWSEVVLAWKACSSFARRATVAYQPVNTQTHGQKKMMNTRQRNTMERINHH